MLSEPPPHLGILLTELLGRQRIERRLVGRAAEQKHVLQVHTSCLYDK